MVRQNKQRRLGDPLSQVHDIAKQRLDGYCHKRPIFQNMSQRRKKSQFLSDAVGYKKYLQEAYLHIVGGCPSGRKQGAHSVLEFIKGSLIKHANKASTGTGPGTIHVYDTFKLKEEIPDHNPYKKKCANQKRLLQIVAAEMESTAMVLYLDQALVQAEIQTDDDKIKMSDPLLEVSELVNVSLDDLRIIYLS